MPRVQFKRYYKNGQVFKNINNDTYHCLVATERMRDKICEFDVYKLESVNGYVMNLLDIEMTALVAVSGEFNTYKVLYAK